jgi:hypothetical protein
VKVGQAAAGRRAGRLLTALACAGSAAVGLAACLIADPGPDLPKPPDLPPSIDHLNVQPPTSLILTSLPINFYAPVTRIDTTVPYFWKVFVDYDNIAQTLPILSSNGATTDLAVSGSITTLPSGPGCHVVELIVADGFGDVTGGRAPTVDGGDSVTWFYSPGGNLAGCPLYTGSFDASFPDSGNDGGEGGDE